LPAALICQPNPGWAGGQLTYGIKYLFADLCGGWIRLFDPAGGTSTLFAQGINAPVDLKVGPDGALYYLARGTGSVGRIATGLHFDFNGDGKTDILWRHTSGSLSVG
jgi:hypothetical protein